MADQITGPWKPANGDISKPAFAPSESPEDWTYRSKNGVVNPALLEMPNGDIHLYFKASYKRGKATMGVAIAKKIQGPYILEQKPVTANEQTIEDGYAFLWNKHVCLMTTDNHGILERSGGLLWVSEDGKTFNKPIPGYHHFKKRFFGGKVPKGANHRYTGYFKNERPQILMIKGSPLYLYTPSGTATDGSDGTNCYLFKRDP